MNKTISTIESKCMWLENKTLFYNRISLEETKQPFVTMSKSFLVVQLLVGILSKKD